MQLIMDHHNYYHHKPGINELRVYGLVLDDTIKKEMESWGFHEFENCDKGFITRTNLDR